MFEIVWIKGFEGKYKITNDGRVFSVRKNGFMSPSHTHGYHTVKLYDGKKYYGRKVHRLVAEHFVPGYRPDLHINHKNGIKTDNGPENLEWVTIQQNNAHAVANGLYKTRPYTPTNGRSKGNGKRVSVKGVNLKTGEEVIYSSIDAASRATGSKAERISYAYRGLSKIYNGYKWELVRIYNISKKWNKQCSPT